MGGDSMTRRIKPGDFVVAYDGELTNDALRKRAVIFGVQLVEPLQNEFRMAFGLGKDDGFADAVATGNLDATGHQILQNGIHGDFVKNKPV